MENIEPDKANKTAIDRLFLEFKEQIIEFQPETREELMYMVHKSYILINDLNIEILKREESSMKIFKERLHNILEQLSSDQQEELFDKLFEQQEFQPEGYPFKYKTKSFHQLSEKEIKYLHDRFIDIQYSEDPTLQGEDIRNVLIFPYI